MRSTIVWSSGPTIGMHSAATTPAIVAWMPELSTKYHSAKASRI